MRNAKHFTLIELLVVIAIISILVSLLLPALKNAKEQARNVICINNEKTMGKAMMLYSDDYKGTIAKIWPIVPDDFPGLNQGFINSNNNAAFSANHRAAWTSKSSLAGDANGIHHGSWVDEGYMSGESLYCPSLSFIAGDPGYIHYKNLIKDSAWRLKVNKWEGGPAPQEWIHSNYAFNTGLTWYGASSDAPWAISGTSFNEELNPSNPNRIHYMESSWPILADLYSPSPVYHVPSSNHKGKYFNVLYADGSVRRHIESRNPKNPDDLPSAAAGNWPFNDHTAVGTSRKWIDFYLE